MRLPAHPSPRWGTAAVVAVAAFGGRVYGNVTQSASFVRTVKAYRETAPAQQGLHGGRVVSEVTVLTTNNCGFCEQAKDVLRRLTTEYGLEVREVPLDSEEGAQLANAAAAPFPPVVFLNDKPFSYGRLSERKLRRALDRERP
jgi:glutaredoxin